MGENPALITEMAVDPEQWERSFENGLLGKQMELLLLVIHTWAKEVEASNL